MTRKRKIQIAIVIIFFVIGASFMILGNISNRGVSDSTVILDENGNTAKSVNVQRPGEEEESTEKPLTQEEIKVQEEEKEINIVRKNSLIFTEKFGSYSNENNFSNLKDLEYLMSMNLKSWADDYIKRNQESNGNGDYKGITTKALSVDIEQFDKENGNASVLVSTQRQEFNGSLEPKVKNQDAHLSFLKENGVWKVDKIEWL